MVGTSKKNYNPSNAQFTEIMQIFCASETKKSVFKWNFEVNFEIIKKI